MMPKLIDADKLKAYLQKNSVNHTLTVDAVSVVRCKDCRWQNTPMCWIAYRKLLDDYDFCCGGIRREDETD